MDNRNGDTPAMTAEEAARRVKEAAGSAAKDVKHAALDQVEQARAKAGDTGHTTATRLRDLAGQVEGDLPWMATAFSKSAEGLDSVTNSLTRGNLDECLNGVSAFAKRQPAIFLGASVALGFALARVGKSALESGQTASPQRDQPISDQATQPFDTASTAYPRPTGV